MSTKQPSEKNNNFLFKINYFLDKNLTFFYNIPIKINICRNQNKIGCETGLSPPVKLFTDRFEAVLLLLIFYVFSVLCLLCLCVRLFICALWSPAGKGLASWLSFVVSNCEFVT